MVDDAQQMLFIIGYQDRMYLISIHYLLNLRDLCLRTDGLGGTGHDVTYRTVEELCLPLLRSPTDVSIRDQSYNLFIHLCYAQAQFAFAHEDDGFSEVHLRR